MNSRTWKTLKSLVAIFQALETSPASFQGFVKKCVLNIKKRAALCVKQKGSHFEHLM